jgi:hypothetical protein
MKKITATMSLLFSLFILSGCDFAEKSFQMIDGLPEAVTMDFELETGVYGTFEWTSDNDDVIAIDSQTQTNLARVTQQETDVDVTLTATIGSRSEQFVVKVLKIGSEPTWLEQSTMALRSLVIPEEAITPFELPKSIGNILLSYHKPNDATFQHFKIIDDKGDSVWILPDIVDSNKDTFITIRSYHLDQDQQAEPIDSQEMWFRVVVDQDVIHPHLQVFQAIELDFAEGDDRDHVMHGFQVPISSAINEDAQLAWEIGENGIGILVMDPEVENVLIIDNPGTHQITLLVAITIDGLRYIFDYLITVRIDE